MILFMGEWNGEYSFKIRILSNLFWAIGIWIWGGFFTLKKHECVRINRWKIGNKSTGRASSSLRGIGAGGPNHVCVRVTGGSSVDQMHPKYSFLFYRSSEFSDSLLCIGRRKKTFLRSSGYLTRHPVTVVKNTKRLESIKGDNLKLIGAALCHTEMERKLSCLSLLCSALLN